MDASAPSPTVKRALNGMRDWASPFLHPQPKTLIGLMTLLDDANQQVRRKQFEDAIGAELTFRGLSADQMREAKEFTVRDPLYADVIFQKPLSWDREGFIQTVRRVVANYFEALL